MKILKIRFNNINSLKGEQKIDFTQNPFASGSLFAITGPTGSGKSTILDVISLALFNQIPRLGGISKNELAKTGAVITKNQLEASAEISYECKVGKFTSKWSIAYNRNNKLNDYGMELSDFETGNILDYKRSEVPAKNEELIGLNYAQFIKSVVLAQGEFAQFLKAKKEERAELLEKITGTGIYRELGKAAYNKFKEVNEAIKDQQAQIAVIHDHLVKEEPFTDLKGQLVKKELAFKGVEELIKKLENQVNIKETIISSDKDIKGINDQVDKNQVALDDFQQLYGKQMQQHENLQPHASSLRSWKQKQERLKETEVAIKETQGKIIQTESVAEKLILTANDLCKEEIKASSFVEKVNTFFEKVTEIQVQKKDKQQAYKNTLDQLNRELKETEFQFDPGNPAKSLEELQVFSSTKKKALQALESKVKGVDLAHLSAARKKLQERTNTILVAKGAAEQISETKASIERLKAKEKILMNEKAELPAIISATDNQIELLSEKLKNLKVEKENKQLKADLSDLRLQLVDKKPCPLCGSFHHPYASEEEAQEDDLDKLIYEKQLNLDQQIEKKTIHKSQLEVLQEKLKDIKEEKNLFENKLNLLEKSFDQKIKELNLNAENIDWKEFEGQTKEQLESIDNIQALRTQTESIAIAIPLHHNLNQILYDGKELERKIKALYSGNNISQETRNLTDNWIENRKSKENFHESKESLEKGLKKQLNELDQLKSDLSTALKAVGFSDIPSALSALLEDNYYLELRNKREYYQKQLDAGKEQLLLLNKQLTELKNKDSKENLEDIQAKLVDKRDQQTELQKGLDEIRSTIKTQENYLKQLEQLKKSIAETEKNNLKWRLLNELIGDANGKRFNDFAQDLSLSQLLILANKRLKDLSDRYLLDKPNLANEDDSLVAVDAHMGGQRRSVKTLSGGETFILSLSMALALSDLASRNVNINSLFIDEGFGTLDPETLDQTLDTLEKLQAESSKTIGIISHVDSLKERISTQIQLSRNGQGYSKIEIVG